MQAILALLPLWVLFTLMAAVMQAVRTAGQKKLREKSSIAFSTAVRSFFGLPFALAYLLWIFPEFFSLRFWGLLTWGFWLSVSLCASFQLIATALLIHLFQLRNFAVGSLYSKIEIILTAIVGMIFFGNFIALSGWIAIVLANVGLIVLTYAKTKNLSLSGLIKEPSALFGFLSATCFALTSLLSRYANQILVAQTGNSGMEANILESAGIILFLVLAIQCGLCLIWLIFMQKGAMIDVRRPLSAYMPLCLFIGATSALGSIGWFSAMALINPAIVKVLGQIEMVFIYAIAVFWFGERLTRLEWLGTAILSLSIMALLLL